MTGVIDALYKRILLAAHPVGSIYQSTAATSPEELFGGTWARIKDRFLLGAGDAYAAGSTGGEEKHTLTTNEMPTHTHFFERSVDGLTTWVEAALGRDGEYSDTTGLDTFMGTSPEVDAFHKWKARISNAGESMSHNNMPPYLTVYTWQRTA